MAKKPDNSENRAERRQERRSGAENSPYKMRSAASRRAEARARAAYRGATEEAAQVGEQRVPVRDVGVRINPDADARHKKKKDELEHELIVRLLHNPTKTVSEDVLRSQYSYVVADIRSMAILAAGLFALLIVLAFVLPR